MRCCLLLLGVSVLLASARLLAQEPDQGYRKPDAKILEVLNAPASPAATLDPARELLLLAQMERYPPIADLAQETLRLAGLRINPRLHALGSIGNADWRPYATAFTLKRIGGDGGEVAVTLPEHPKVALLAWSPDGARFAFSNTTADGVELWIAESATGAARRIAGVRLDDVLGSGAQWLPDHRTLLVKIVPEGLGAPERRSSVPAGPNIQETAGKSASSTYEARDVLKTAADEDQFEYLATSQLALVDATTGEAKSFAAPGLYRDVQASPDGEHVLVERLHRPFSRLFAENRFPVDVEVLGRDGRVQHTLAQLPLADQVPIEGVRTGPRAYAWCPTQPATLVWAEALDGGNPKTQVPFRDRVLALRAPFSAAPAEIAKTEQRFTGIQWLACGKLALVHDHDPDRRWRRTFVVSTADPAIAPRLLWDRSASERYKDPGNPITMTLPSGHRVIQQIGSSIYLAGAGASQEGDRPFLDRLDLETFATERLFRCDSQSYESVVALVGGDGRTVLTARETPRDPPNYFVRTLGERVESPAAGEAQVRSTARAVTSFPDPTPQLRGIEKRLVRQARPDGVEISMNVYLPPGYTPGTRLPTVLYAYPLEHSDPALASQVVGSQQRFTTITGASHLFFLLAGYAVLEPTMPCVGPPKTVYDTFVEQLVANARAAIDKAVQMGVTDPDRVGVVGHSHGGLMAANLLAHCDLFRAGIARSGAHNKTLTAFGFQTERRTLWEAPDTYIKVSPLFFADKIKDPLLLIHGERDANPGTVPMQSERLYEAIRGNGGQARLVMLPLESHAYVARESVEHTIYEMITWFDRHVKQAKPRRPASD